MSRFGIGSILILVVLPACCALFGSEPNPDAYTADERSHWSFQAPSRPDVPEFQAEADREWIRTPIDAFILSKLNEAGLRSAAAADRRTLLRRLSFDLTGLPPTPAQIAEFLADRSPDAYERLVDRLLADPQYGQRWGQHWLDVVRFAETEGFEYDAHNPEAWRFRDYVVRSLNADEPFDRFVMEQLAGDELAGDGNAHEPAVRDALIAVGFYRLGPVRRNAGNAEVSFSRNEVLTERIDVVGSAFLGLTVGCARCHDHMFDPIRHTDYYRLQAFLAETHDHDVPLADADVHARWKKQADRINAKIYRIKQAIGNANGEEEERLRAELEQAEAQLPAPLPTLFSVRNDQSERTPIHLLERGDESRKQQRLGMRVPGVLLPDGTAELPADAPQPKTTMARWIASAENPLTARVIVNRVWQYHMHRAIVATPNDFGANGRPPTHPKLLDYLATEFVAHGWSLKWLHRQIVTSSIYRQASRVANDEYPHTIDAENKLYWKFPRRRLSAEEVRDAMLAVSGRLNHKPGGPSVIVPVDEELIKLLYKPSQWSVTEDTREHDRRSIYLLAKRNLRLPFLEVFDQPDLQISCARRESTTHAPQSLELLNGDLSNRLAEAFAERLQREAGGDHSRVVQLAFEITAGKPPTRKEREFALAFLQTQPLREFALAMFNLNAFLYVD